MAKLYGASVVLGSATPSLEAYYRAGKGEYRMLSLIHISIASEKAKDATKFKGGTF